MAGPTRMIAPIAPGALADELRILGGLSVSAASLRPEWRSWRWVVHLPDNLLAFVADNEAAARRLAVEAKLLRLLASRVTFAVPRVEFIDLPAGLQIRRMVPGTQIGGAGLERAFAALPNGLVLANQLGQALGELHGAVTKGEAAEIGLNSVRPFRDCHGLPDRLRGRLPEPAQTTLLERLVALENAIDVPDADVVVVHGDLWGGNLAVDHETGALRGIFDFDNAGLADRHIDLMYIPSFGEAFTARVFAAYAAASGIRLSPQRTAIYHALAAFQFLADAHEKEDATLLGQRLDWISDVCSGTVGRLALGESLER